MRRHRSVSIALLVAWVAAAALPSPAAADHQPGCAAGTPVPDQAFAASPNAGDYAWTPFGYRPSDAVGGVALAQTVTVGRSGTLLTISLLLHGTDISGVLPVEVRAGTPTGALLAVGSMARADLIPGGWVEVMLDPAPAVRAGDAIAIVLPALAPTHDADSPGVQPRVVWVTSADDDPGYPGGTSWSGDRRGTDPGVSSWAEFPNDRHFRTSVCGLPDTATLEAGDARSPLDALRPAVLVLAAAAGLLFGLRAGRNRRRPAAPIDAAPGGYDLRDADPANPGGPGRGARRGHLDAERAPRR